MNKTDETTSLLTDRYELTMLTAALSDGTADRRCAFEVFARRLPNERRFGVVAGTGRLLDALAAFRFGDDELAYLDDDQVVPPAVLDWLANYRFQGDIDGYREGEPYFPGSPILTVRGTFAEAVILETLVLSIFNYDSAVASAAARMVNAAGDRPLIEMGSRRTGERSAVHAARAAYLAGFAATSNLEAGRRYGIPTLGTSAHAFTLLHDTEAAAFRAQVAALGTDTTLLVDTYDITAGVQTAIEVAGTELGAVRIDSGDLGVLAVQTRRQLDELGATNTKIVLSGDLDEYAIAALNVAPVNSYGAGTSVVTGSGSPTAGMVYKLVEVEGMPVAKRSEGKPSRGGMKTACRLHKPTGTAIEEIIRTGPPVELSAGERPLQIPLVRDGEPVRTDHDLHAARRYLREAMVSLPWDGLKLSRGEPAIPTVFENPPEPAAE